MATTYTKAKLDATLRRRFPAASDSDEIAQWSEDDLARLAIRAAAFAHAGIIELDDGADLVVTAAVRDVATFGGLRFADPFADMTPRRAAVHLAQEFYCRLTAALDIETESDWQVAMQDGSPHSWFVKRRFEHAADGRSMKGEIIVWFDVLEKAVTSLAFLPGDGVSHMFGSKDVGAILKHDVYDVNDQVLEGAEPKGRFDGVPTYSLAMAAADGAFSAATEGLPEMGRESWVVEDEERDVELSCEFTLLVRDGAEMRRDVMRFLVVFDPDLRDLRVAGFFQPGNARHRQGSSEGETGTSRWLSREEKRDVMDRIRL